MTAFRRGRNLSLYVPLRSGGFAQRSAGTSSRRVVNALRELLYRLRDERRWTLLEAVLTKPPRLTLMALYDASVAHRLDALEAELGASTLAPYVDGWGVWVTSTLGDTGSAELYRFQVDRFFASLGHPATTSDLTAAAVTPWLAGLAVSPGTRRKNFYALKSFVRYLLDHGPLTADPLAGYRAPKKNPPRMRWETVARDQAIVDAASPQYRVLFAFVKSTGADLSAALRAIRRDVDLERAKVLIRGSKTAQRTVHEAWIEPWALPYLAPVASLTPNAPLFPGLTRSGAAHHHTKCCAAVKVDGYTLKDARHSVAVRARFAGKTFEDIAAQLGNSVYQVVMVYARFQPSRATDSATSPVLRISDHA